MTTTIQHNPVLLQQQQNQKEDEDVALANYLTTSLRFDQSQDLWSYSTPAQQHQQLYNHKNNAHYYQQQQQQQQQQQRPTRPRTRKSSNSTTSSVVSSNSINPHQLQKSVSTPISSRTSGTRSSSSSRSPASKPKYPSSSTSSLSQPPFSCSDSSKSIKTNHITTSNKPRSVNSAMSLQQPPHYQERRPSMTGSVVSNSGASIQSEMSVNTKLSLSKRLRKVFSMNNLRSSISSSDLASLAERNGSNSSIASSVVGSPLSQTSVDTRNPMSFRRRSIASLSSLFQKGGSDADSIRSTTSNKKSVNAPSSNSISHRRHSSGDLRQLVKEEKKRPDLRVDTTESANNALSVPQARKGGLKVRSSSSTNNNNHINNNTSNNYNNSTIAPDSPNSAISSRSSFTRLPPPAQQRNFIHLPEPGLPSPTPSTASSIKQGDEDYIKPNIGLQYGLGLHGSPRLKPASSSTSSLVAVERKIQFCSTIQIHETFAATDYDRRCDTNATCQKLTPMMAMKIKQELNEFKLTDMEVHVESRQYTHFFL